MNKHTPGPWKVHRSELLGGFSAITDASGKYILFSPLHDFADQLDTHYADIDLVAAAPDMLAASKTVCLAAANVVRESAGKPLEQPVRDLLADILLMTAAIAKAEGDS